MNRGDPTAIDHSLGCAVDHELSLDEMAAIQTQEGDLSVSVESIPRQDIADVSVSTIPIPSVPFPPLPKRLVSGRYQIAQGGFQLELRVDVDGKHPLMKVSGDFYKVSGSTTAYFGSFVVDTPTLNVQPALVTIDGLGRYTWAAGAPKVHITIPRNIIFVPAAPATLRFFTTANVPGAQYICQYASPYFRTVKYEVDRVADVPTPVFSSYNTGSLPSGGPARNLSVVSAYAEAGVEMQVTSGSDIIPINEEGWDHNDPYLNRWSDAELNHSMELHFSLWRDLPQWAVWQAACWEHDAGTGLYGIMFDQQGAQRQGCAVFYAGIGGITSDKLRLQLYTYVHELGHCFNLMHSWQKSLATPPQPNNAAAHSWMNYPWYYPGGAQAFWSSFPFQFEDPELVHIRHAFRNEVVMGGNNFTVGAAIDKSAFDDNIVDNSGLKLEISVDKPNKSFLFGEPLMIRVALTGQQGRLAHPYLHPNSGMLQLGICKPDGQVLAYRPLIDHCVVGKAVAFGPENPVLEDVVYCGYGKDGFYFDRTGFYQLRAIYNAPDGSRVLSNLLRLRVRHPVTAADEEVADLFFGQDQGTIFYLQGSDSEFLKHGNDCLRTVVEKYPNHPLAHYAMFVQGVNASRPFKVINTEKREIRARWPRHEESAKMLARIIEASEKIPVLDSITLDKAVQSLATMHTRMGDKAAAEAAQKHLKGSGKKSLATVS